MRRTPVFMLALSMVFGLSQPAHAVIAEGVATGIVLDKLHDEFSDLIDKSRDSGDFLVWRVAIMGRDLIDAFQKSNTELLKIAFNKIDQQKQDLLRGIDANVDKLSSQTSLAFDQAENLTSEWSQIISTTYVASSRPYVMTYSPRVLVPDGESTIRLRVVGPNIGRAAPTLKGAPFDTLKPSTPVEQAAVFELSRSAFHFPDTESAIQHLDLNYNVPKYIVFNGNASNTLDLWLLPRILGHYKITTKVNSVNHQTDNRVVNLGHFSGRNSRIARAVIVPDTSLGWRLDLTRRNDIKLLQGGADKGRCEGIEDQSITENGLTMFARVDNRDQAFHHRDAWTDCSISLPLYRDTTVESDGISAEGNLSWTKDVAISVPDELRSIKIEMDIFDKRSRIFTGNGSDRYFDIRLEGGQVIFRP